jgi:hypothetical protein
MPSFLQALVTNSGNRLALHTAIWSPPVHLKRSGIPPSTRNANLPLEAAVKYGLLEAGSYQATGLSQNLAKMQTPELYEEFARHILLQLGGLRVVEAAQQMKLDGRPITGDSLAQYLVDQGFRVRIHNTAINSLRMWLAVVGVFYPKHRGWNVDEVAKERILGIPNQAVHILPTLSREEIAFVEALCRINPSGWCRAAEVRTNAETYSGLHLGRQNLRDLLDPLKVAGLIEYQSGGTQGGKSAVLRTTAAFTARSLQPFLADTIKTLDSVVAAYYLRSPADIYADLDSTETATKGAALEALAIQIMRLLGLRFMAWRKRARDSTGRAEIDVLLTGIFGGVPTRWQIQCKNTPSGRIDLEDVAKEVGLLPLTRATHVMLLGNCLITRDARTFANQVMANSPTSIYLLDRHDFDAIRASPGSISTILLSQSETIQRGLEINPNSVWKI